MGHFQVLLTYLMGGYQNVLEDLQMVQRPLHNLPFHQWPLTVLQGGKNPMLKRLVYLRHLSNRMHKWL